MSGIYIFEIIEEIDKEIHDRTIKIGRANNIYDRLSQHSTSSPNFFVYGFFIGEPKELEATIHKLFDIYRITKEFFKFRSMSKEGIIDLIPTELCGARFVRVFEVYEKRLKPLFSIKKTTKKVPQRETIINKLSPFMENLYLTSSRNVSDNFVIGMFEIRKFILDLNFISDWETEENVSEIVEFQKKLLAGTGSFMFRGIISLYFSGESFVVLDGRKRLSAIYQLLNLSEKILIPVQISFGSWEVVRKILSAELPGNELSRYYTEFLKINYDFVECEFIETFFKREGSIYLSDEKMKWLIDETVKKNKKLCDIPYRKISKIYSDKISKKEYKVIVKGKKMLNFYGEKWFREIVEVRNKEGKTLSEVLGKN